MKIFVFVAVVGLVQSGVALTLLRGDGQVNCKERDHVIPNSRQILTELDNLVPSQNLTELGLQAMEGPKFSQSHVTFVAATIASRQQEIEQTQQHTLPLSQRTIVSAAAVRSNLDNRVIVATEKFHQAATAGSKSPEFSKEQQVFGQLMSRVHSLRESVLLENEKQTASQEQSLTQIAVSRITEQQQQQLLQTTTTTTKTTTTLLLLLDELVETLRQSRTARQAEMSRDREEWGRVMDIAQSELESFTELRSETTRCALQNIKQANVLAKYLRSLTAEQYKETKWNEEMLSNVKKLGQNSHTARVEGLSVRTHIAQLKDVLENGCKNAAEWDNLKPQGCDGAGGAIDSCGVCGGNNSTCLSCDGIPNGQNILDVCGVCGGQGLSCRTFCDGKANSGLVEDVCGVCGGDAVTCQGCDSIPFSDHVWDTCGVCGGHGETCAAKKNCVGVLDSCTTEVACPEGSQVTSEGFKSCCFDPSFDCVVQKTV